MSNTRLSKLKSLLNQNKIRNNSSVLRNLLIIFVQTELLTLICGFLYVLIWNYKLTFLLPVISLAHIVTVNPNALQGFSFPTLISNYIWIIVLAVIEELIFRFVPYQVFKNYLNTSVRLTLYIITTSILFAFMHNTTFVYGFRFPLTQFIAGLYYAYLYKYKNGFGYAVFSHTFFNVSVGLIIWLVAFAFK